MAIRMINSLKDTSVLKVSRLIETQPVGGPAGQPLYLNGAARISTGLTPRRLLTSIKSIERSLGRKRAARNGPRAIDIDILLYGNTIIRTKGLIVPHPRMFERDFVLGPLAQILE